MTLHTSADAPITCAYWDEVVAEDGFLGLGRRRRCCTYAIYTDGTYYYSENGTTGALAYGGPNNLPAGTVDGTNFRDVFQATIDALDRGSICIGEGVYEWDDDITIDDRKNIIGAGVDSTTLRRTTANKTITILPGVAWTEGIYLTQMTLDGNDLDGTILDVQTGRRCSLQYLRVANSNDTGIHLSDGWGIDMNRCYVDSNDIGVLSEVNGAVLTHCILRFNDTTNMRIISEGTGNVLIGCVIEKANDAGAWNLEIQGGTKEEWADHKLIGCSFEDAPAGGGNIKIFNRSANDITGVKITNNYISEDGTGIWIEEATDTKILANHFRGVGTGVDIQASASDTVVAYNELDSTTEFADAGSGSMFRDNLGYNPVGNIANPFDAGNGLIEVSGAAATPAANTDYTVSGMDIKISSTDSGNTDCAIMLKDPGGNNVLQAALSTIDHMYVPRGFQLNWGAFTGAAPTVTVSFV